MPIKCKTMKEARKYFRVPVKETDLWKIKIEKKIQEHSVILENVWAEICKLKMRNWKRKK